MASRSIRSRLRRYSVWMLLTLIITGFLVLNLRETKGKLVHLQALSHAVTSLSERNRSLPQARLLAIASLPAITEYSSTVAQALYGTADDAPMHNILASDDIGTSIVAMEMKWRSTSGIPLAWSSDGQQVLTGDTDGVVRLWDAVSGVQLRSFTESTDKITAVQWIYRNEGSTVTKYVLAGSEDGTAHIWNAATGRLIRSLDAQAGSVTAVAWNPSDDWSVAVGYEDGSIRIWLARDIWTGDTKEQPSAPNLCRIPGQANRITALAWNSIGDQRIVSGDTTTARIWAAATCQPLMTFSKQIGPVTALAWRSDDQQVLLGSSDGYIEVWNIGNGAAQEQTHMLTRYAGEITAVAYISNVYGEQIFAGGRDGTASLWDAFTGAEIRSLRGYLDSSWAVTPEGGWIINTAIDQAPNIWPTDMGYIIADLTRDVCAQPDDDKISAENPAWQGCVAELTAVADDLRIYDALRGKSGG